VTRQIVADVHRTVVACSRIDSPAPRPDVVLVPAHCNACGLDFQPRAIAVANGATNITFTGNRTNCPRCGGVAQLMDGTFSVKDDRFEILSAPSVTREMLARLQLLIDEAEAHPSNLDAVRQKAEAIHAGFGALFGVKDWSPNVKAALIAAVTAVLVAKCSGGGTTVINVAPRLIIEMPEQRKPEPPIGRFGSNPLPIRFKS